MKIYQISVRTARGKSETQSDLTRDGVNAWLGGWLKPADLSATVTNMQTGNVVAVKKFGFDRIEWPTF